MKSARTVGLLTVTMSMVASSLLTATGASASAASPPHLMSGVVLTSLGTPAAGAEVQIGALSGDENVQDVIPVGSAVADDDGRFTISGLPDDPALQTGGGELYLQVRGHTATESVLTGLTAVLPVTGGEEWTLPETTEGSLYDAKLRLQNPVTGAFTPRPLTFGQPQQQAFSASSAETTSTASVIDDADAVDGAEGSSESGSATPVTPPAGVEIPMLVSMPTTTGPCPAGYNPRWIKTSQLRYSYVPVQFGQTRGKSTMTYSYDTSNNTSLEVTYTKDGTGWSGGLTGSASQVSNRNYTYKFLNSVQKVLKLEWSYVRWDEYCISSGPAMYFKTGSSMWKPNKIASGSKAPNTSSTFSCNDANVSFLAATTTVARTSQVRWDGWFEIAGSFRADLRQENSSSERLTLTPDSGQTAKICGSNAKPLDANRVKEVL